jgi:hypothetical protein
MSATFDFGNNFGNFFVSKVRSQKFHLPAAILLSLSMGSLSRAQVPTPAEQKKVVNPYLFLGQYNGLRYDENQPGKNLKINENKHSYDAILEGDLSGPTSNRPLEARVRFMKKDYGGPGFDMIVNFEEIQDEEGTWSDHFIFQANFTAANFKKLFFENTSVQNDKAIALGPDFEKKPRDVYQMNTATMILSEDKKTRVIKIETEIGDRGKLTRKYVTQLSINEGKLNFLTHQKFAPRRFWGGFSKIADFQTGDFSQVAIGLELLDYGRLTKPKLIERASVLMGLDANRENFNQLIDEEKQPD